MNKFDLYRDIATRTGGDIYLGVVGPVRTGKSTFIKQFMDEIALDSIENPDAKKRATDELPQSADGKTIMTTQPKFVPNEAVKVSFSDNLSVNLRLIDCVGYLVDGALGVEEDGKERMVKTPWSSDEIPFSQAAEIGTDKVIREHSTIALAVTTDGSFTDIPRAGYSRAEDKVISELKGTGKPFAILLNTLNVNSESALSLADELKQKYDAPVIIKNVLKMNEDDICEIMESILLEFSVQLIDFEIPRWTQALEFDDEIIKELAHTVKSLGDEVEKMKDFELIDGKFENSEFWKVPSKIDLDAGKGRI
ncbi:MAG: stage IV sporulation protein A, partial [Clostridia bacterium]|nr:stage IV sporulation protein A [Clostridia bacterium]